MTVPATVVMALRVGLGVAAAGVAVGAAVGSAVGTGVGVDVGVGLAQGLGQGIICKTGNRVGSARAVRHRGRGGRWCGGRRGGCTGVGVEVGVVSPSAPAGEGR